jgi:hypothetical protein
LGFTRVMLDQVFRVDIAAESRPPERLLAGCIGRARADCNTGTSGAVPRRPSTNLAGALEARSLPRPALPTTLPSGGRRGWTLISAKRSLPSAELGRLDGPRVPCRHRFCPPGALHLGRPARAPVGQPCGSAAWCHNLPNWVGLLEGLTVRLTWGGSRKKAACVAQAAQV